MICSYLLVILLALLGTLSLVIEAAPMSSGSEYDYHCHIEDKSQPESEEVSRSILESSHVAEPGDMHLAFHDGSSSQMALEEDAAAQFNLWNRDRQYKVKHKIRRLFEGDPNSRKAHAIMEREGWNMEDIRSRKEKEMRPMDKYSKNLVKSRITALRHAIEDFDKNHQIKKIEGYYKEECKERKYYRKLAKSSKNPKASKEALEMLEYIRETMLIFRKCASDIRLIERVDYINNWMQVNMCPPYQKVQLPNLPEFQMELLPGSMEALQATPEHLSYPKKGQERDSYIAHMFGEKHHGNKEGTHYDTLDKSDNDDECYYE